MKEEGEGRMGGRTEGRRKEEEEEGKRRKKEVEGGRGRGSRRRWNDGGRMKK